MKKQYFNSILFISITFLLTWSVHLFLYFFNFQGRLNFITYTMFIPIIVALMLYIIGNKNDPLRIKKPIIKRSFFINILLIAGIFLLIDFISAFLFLLWNKNFIISFPSISSILLNLLIGITIATISALGEEAGWRWYLQKNLSFLGFWKSSFLIGFIWGIWHLPQIVEGLMYRGHPFWGLLIHVILFSLIGVILSFFTIKEGNIVIACIGHGLLNSIYFSKDMLYLGSLTDLIRGLSGILICSLIVVFLYYYDKKFGLNIKRTD